MTDPLEAALLPCPFCGAPPRVIEDDTYGNCQVFCVCEPEPCVMRPMAEMDAARAAWNRRALLAREQAVAGWQPIETAPKDGTAIFGYQATPGEYEGRIAVVWTWSEGRLWSCADYPGLRPTHWLPLPAPPGQEQPPSQAVAMTKEEHAAVERAFMRSIDIVPSQAVADAYRRGQEEMRERAAVLANKWSDPYPPSDTQYRDGMEDAAVHITAAIRALKTKEPA